MLFNLHVFNLSSEQQSEAVEWVGRHECSITEQATIGGKITYEFTPTGVGVVEKVSCLCGKSKNLTNYDEW